jgi:hypothetical protein
MFQCGCGYKNSSICVSKLQSFQASRRPQALPSASSLAHYQAISLTRLTMLISSIFFFASSATAFSLPDISSILPLFARDGGSNCPTVWSDVSRELTSKFLTNGQCNPDARAAIRLIFHDCGAWNKAQGAKGGCDGSLILAGELTRGENKGLQGIADYIQGRATFYKVPVADMIGMFRFSSYPPYHLANAPSSLRRQPRNRNLPWRPRRQDLRRPQRFLNTCT